jgi:hypothetical protein
MEEAFSQSHIMVGCVEIIVRSAECFPAPHFGKICLPKGKWWPKSKIKVNVLD